MHVFRKSFVGLLFVALAVTACSQVPSSELANQPGALTPQFGTPDDDEGNSVFVSRRTDAVYVIGERSRDNSYVIETDAFLRRYKPDGTLAWRKTFNATTQESLTDLAEDVQGNIIVSLVKNSGNSESTSELFKYTSAGRELWRRPLVGFNVHFSVDITPTGEFYVVGEDSSSRSLIQKYNQNGILQWTKRFAERQFSAYSDSATDSAGNLYIVGYHGVIYKFDPTGKLVWTRSVPLGTADYLDIRDITIVQDSLLLVGFKTWDLIGPDYEYDYESDALVVSYSLNGAQNWQRTFGTKDSDYGRGIASDNRGNLYVAASLSTDASPASESYVVRKYTLAGKLLKQTTTAKNLNRERDYVFDMAAYRNDEVYLTGQTTHDLGAGFAGGLLDAFLMRVDGQGNQVWVR